MIGAYMKRCGYLELQSCIIVTWWSGSGRIQAWSQRPTGFLQCFDTVGLVIWPVKIVPEMTYNVLSATLSLYTYRLRSRLCLKKVPTYKLSVTLSNLNRFSNFCTAGNRMKFATKPTQHYPLHLKNVATLIWDIKNSKFLQIFSKYGKMQRNCIFSAPILIPLPA